MRVLTADVRLEGFTPEQWALLAEVFRAPAGDDDGEVRADAGVGSPGGVAIVTNADNTRVRKALHTRTGRIEPSELGWPRPLEEVATERGARFVVRFTAGALEALMERWGERVDADHDAAEQLVLLVTVLRELEAEELVEAWPWTIGSWPLPNARIRQRALDALCPDGKSLLLGVFRSGELATAIALRRRGDAFDYILGPEELREEMGLIAGDWTRDYRHLLRAVESRLGPVAVGCYGELDTFQQLAARPGPGVWATAVAARDIILSPVTPALAIPLGVDVGRAAYVAIRGIAERLGAGGWFGSASPLMPAVERVLSVVEDRDVIGMLGFDPIDLLRKVLARRREGDEP